MHTFTVALAIGTAVMLAACGTQEGEARAQPPQASGLPADQAAPAPVPGRAAPPSGAPPAPPAAQTPAVPATAPAAVPAVAPASRPSPPPASPAAPSASQAAVDAAAERDLRISREVRAGLTRDTHLARDAKDVQVSTSAGVVTLTGTVSSDADRRAIRSQAERVSGVVRVEDQLVVR
jgi:hypothetical protein